MQIPALTIADTCAFEDWNGLKRTMPLGNVVPLQRQKEIITWWHEVFDLLTTTLTTLNNLFFLWTQIIVNWPWIFVKLIFSLICGDSRSKQHHLGTIHCFHTFFIACWRQRYTFIRVGADRIQLRACLRQRQLVRNCRRKSYQLDILFAA